MTAFIRIKDLYFLTVLLLIRLSRLLRCPWLKRLSENSIICRAGDDNLGRKRVKLPFLGRVRSFATGMFTLSAIADTYACVSLSLLAVNNVFYRFKHLIYSSNENYQALPARIKMNIMASVVRDLSQIIRYGRFDEPELAKSHGLLPKVSCF